MTVTESLVQVTMVAGPPVEIHVRVNMKFGSRVKVTAADTERFPFAISEIIVRDFAHDRTLYIKFDAIFEVYRYAIWPLVIRQYSEGTYTIAHARVTEIVVYSYQETCWHIICAEHAYMNTTGMFFTKR